MVAWGVHLAMAGRAPPWAPLLGVLALSGVAVGLALLHINNPPSGSRSGSFTAGTPVGCQNRTTGTYLVGGTVTSDVASFVAGSVTNFGWMLRDDVEGSATTRTMTFSSKELATVAQEPQLVITYVAVP